MDKFIATRNLSWYQFCRRRQHRKLSYRQPSMSPMKTEATSRQRQHMAPLFMTRLALLKLPVFSETPTFTRHGPLTRYVELRVAHALGMPRTFLPQPLFSDPDMHRGTCVTHVPWCILWSLTSGFLWCRWRGKRSRYSRRMRNPQFCISGKRPMPCHSSLLMICHRCKGITYACYAHSDCRPAYRSHKHTETNPV